MCHYCIVQYLAKMLLFQTFDDLHVMDGKCMVLSTNISMIFFFRGWGGRVGVAKDIKI